MAVDGFVLGGNFMYNGRPVVHTGNPVEDEVVTVRAS